MPSDSENCAGAPALPIGAPSASRAVSFHGVEPCSLPPYSSFGIATGTTPRAIATSALTHETVATRVGCRSIVVEPKAWVMVTGKASAAAVAGGAPAPAPAPAGPGEPAGRARRPGAA